MNNLGKIIHLKKDILLFLNSDFVDLKKLRGLGSKFTNLRDELDQELQRVLQINPLSK